MLWCAVGAGQEAQAPLVPGGAQTQAEAEAAKQREKELAEAKKAAEAQLKETITELKRVSTVAEQSGDLLGAVDAVLELRRVDPENATHLTRLLTLYERAGMQEKRVETYRELLKLKPGNATYTVGLGTALYRLGKTEEGRELWNSLLVEDKTPVNVFTSVGNAYRGEMLYEQALVVFEQALEYYTDNYSLLHNKAYVLEMLGRTDEAITFYELARAKTKNPAYIDSKLAKLYVVSGRRDDILKEKHDQALTMIEALAKKTKTVGEKLASQGKQDEARKHYERALALTESEELRTELQRALEKLGK